MIEPTLIQDELLHDIKRAREADETYHIWWLGQSGFLLKWKNRHLIIDPYLSDALATQHANDPARSHVRMTERVVDPITLDFIDVALVSHAHPDHLDPKTLRPIWTVSPAMRMIIPESLRDDVAETLRIHKALPIGIDDGESVEYADFTITGIAAAHEELETDEDGRSRYLGYVLEFGDGFTVYFSGDTVRYEGLAERLQSYSIDVAILPINGRNPDPSIAGNLNVKEAAELGKEIGAGVVIPCHYDMFAHNTASVEDFVSEAERIEQPHHVLRSGERWSNTG